MSRLEATEGLMGKISAILEEEGLRVGSDSAERHPSSYAEFQEIVGVISSPRPFPGDFEAYVGKYKDAQVLVEFWSKGLITVKMAWGQVYAYRHRHVASEGLVTATGGMGSFDVRGLAAMADPWDSGFAVKERWTGWGAKLLPFMYSLKGKVAPTLDTSQLQPGW
jgi:hypothetical protein